MPDLQHLGDTGTSAALGGEYEFGTLRLTLRPSHLVLLDLIDSPLIRDGVTECDLVDLARALYVIAEGQRATNAVHGLKQRQRSLCRLLDEHRELDAKALLAAQAEVDGKGWAAFDEAAISWYDRNCSGADAQLGMTVLQQMLDDAIEALRLVGRTDGDGQKKTAITTRLGWPAIAHGLRWLVSSLRRFWPRRWRGRLG